MLLSRHWFFVAALWVLWQGALLSTKASAGEPTVEIELATPKVFVNEFPMVRVRVTAPPDAPIDVIRPDLYRGLGLTRELFDPDGKSVPSIEPRIVPPPAVLPPDAKLSVSAGKTLEWPAGVFSLPPGAGRYRLHVAYQLDWPRGQVVKQDLFVDAVSIDPANITSHLQVSNGEAKQEVELMTVRDGKEAVLLHVSKRSWVSRVARIAPETRLVSAQTPRKERDRYSEPILIVLQTGSELRAITVDYGSGQFHWPQYWVHPPRIE